MQSTHPVLSLSYRFYFGRLWNLSEMGSAEGGGLLGGGFLGYGNLPYSLPCTLFPSLPWCEQLQPHTPMAVTQAPLPLSCHAVLSPLQQCAELNLTPLKLLLPSMLATGTQRELT